MCHKALGQGTECGCCTILKLCPLTADIIGLTREIESKTCLLWILKPLALTLLLLSATLQFKLTCTKLKDIT